MTAQILTEDELRLILDYDPETGVFTNRVTRNPRAKQGAPAGATTSEGYTAFQINGKKMYAHRAAWLYMTGKWPVKFIDHINRNRNDNRFVNLREATACLNSQNTDKHTRNTSGHKGVTWNKKRNCWQVQMRANNKVYYVGSYTLLSDAVQARSIAEIFTHARA
jgi:hypothetical protein